MARGDKSKYSSKQKKQAEDIEKGYESRGVSEKEAKRRAWATVNKMWGKAARGTGQKKPSNVAPAKKGGQLGAKASASRSSAAKSASAKKAANTRAKTRRQSSPKRKTTTRRALSSKRAAKK